MTSTKVVMLFILLAILGIVDTIQAQGDLLVTPRRVVFEGNNDRQEITLANTGNDTARYTISFVQYRMTEEGTFEIITEPDSGQFFADPYLRYFPRSVNLAPRESQVVRMQLRRSADMVEGEYRSHMYFRAVPVEKPLGEEDRPDDSTAIGIRLTPIFGITIPVIVRIGELPIEVTLSDLFLDKNEEGVTYLNLKFNRKGLKSVYGDLTVDYVSPEGIRSEVGVVRGIAVYTPIPSRKFRFEINAPEGSDFTQGKLIVRYASGNEAKPEVFAEHELMLKK